MCVQFEVRPRFGFLKLQEHFKELEEKAPSLLLSADFYKFCSTSTAKRWKCMQHDAHAFACMQSTRRHHNHDAHTKDPVVQQSVKQILKRLLGDDQRVGNALGQLFAYRRATGELDKCCHLACCPLHATMRILAGSRCTCA